MRIETSIKRRDQAITQLRDLYSSARICGMSSADLNSGIRRIIDTTLSNVPKWAIAEFKGYSRALGDQLYIDALMFGGFVDGKFYSTHRDRSDYYETNGIAPAEYADNGRVKARGHYWKTTATPRPFFVMEGTE